MDKQAPLPIRYGLAAIACNESGNPFPPEISSWIARAFKRYFNTDGDVTLEQCFGMTGGARSNVYQIRFAQRNKLISSAYSFCKGNSETSRRKALLEIMKKVETKHREWERPGSSGPGTEAEQLIYHARKIWRKPLPNSDRGLYDCLRFAARLP